MGLDKPLWLQFWNFSRAHGQVISATRFFHWPVFDVVMEQLPFTLALIAGMTWSIALGIPLDALPRPPWRLGRQADRCAFSCHDRCPVLCCCHLRPACIAVSCAGCLPLVRRAAISAISCFISSCLLWQWGWAGLAISAGWSAPRCLKCLKLLSNSRAICLTGWWLVVKARRSPSAHHRSVLALARCFHLPFLQKLSLPGRVSSLFMTPS